MNIRCPSVLRCYEYSVLTLCPAGCLAQHPLLRALLAARRLPWLSNLPLVTGALLEAQHSLSVPFHPFGVILAARRPSDSACSWLICAILAIRRPSSASRHSPSHSKMSCML